VDFSKKAKEGALERQKINEEKDKARLINIFSANRNLQAMIGFISPLG